MNVLEETRTFLLTFYLPPSPPPPFSRPLAQVGCTCYTERRQTKRERIGTRCDSWGVRGLQPLTVKDDSGKRSARKKCTLQALSRHRKDQNRISSKKWKLCLLLMILCMINIWSWFSYKHLCLGEVKICVLRYDFGINLHIVHYLCLRSSIYRVHCAITPSDWKKSTYCAVYIFFLFIY
jgi:hypothetical protein